MEKRPPHLPQEQGTTPTAKHLGILALNLVVTFVIALCATLITIAWISPKYIPETKIVTIQQKEPIDISERTLDTFILDQMLQRRVRVYQANASVEKIGQYSTAGYIADALLISTDGWAVLHVPADRVNAPFSWRAVDHKGDSHAIEASVVDPVAGLVYIKLASSDVRADVAFAQYKDLQEGELVWGIAKQQAEALQVIEQSPVAPAIINLRTPVLSFALAQDVPIGTLLTTEQGVFVGFVSEQGIIPAWFVSEQISHVFAGTPFAYESLPVTAVLLDTVVERERTLFQNGLYIQRVPTKASSSTLGVGDIVVQVDGNDIDASRVAFDIMRSVHDDVLVSILRNGTRIQLQVPKESITK